MAIEDYDSPKWKAIRRRSTAMVGHWTDNVIVVSTITALPIGSSASRYLWEATSRLMDWLIRHPSVTSDHTTWTREWQKCRILRIQTLFWSALRQLLIRSNEIFTRKISTHWDSFDNCTRSSLWPAAALRVHKRVHICIIELLLLFQGQGGSFGWNLSWFDRTIPHSMLSCGLFDFDMDVN